jgi:hypothetical protein
MAAPNFPGFAELAAAAVVADSMTASLNKADAMMVPGLKADYRRHLLRAMNSFDDLAARMAVIRAALEES